MNDCNHNDSARDDSIINHVGKPMNHSSSKILENNKGKILVVAQCDRAYYPHKVKKSSPSFAF